MKVRVGDVVLLGNPDVNPEWHWLMLAVVTGLPGRGVDVQYDFGLGTTAALKAGAVSCDKYKTVEVMRANRARRAA